MLFFWFAAKLVGAWTALFQKLTPNQFLRDLLRQAVRGLLLIIGLLVALDFLGATAIVGTVLGAAGLVGLAVSFAFRDTIENYIASILLSLRQPFAPNDHVVIEGHEGRVVRLTSRATILLTFDGNHVRIPNAKVFRGIVINYTRNPHRRFEFLVGINATANLSAAQTVTEMALGRMSEILTDPPPQCWVEELGHWNVILNISGWIDQRSNDFLKVRSEALRQVKEALEDAGIGMPEPIYRLRLRQSETTPSHHAGAAIGKSKKAKAANMRSCEFEESPIDLSPDTHIADVVQAERAVAKDKDLLNSQAPLE
jgi:small-conductance mechanosensitive channel